MPSYGRSAPSSAVLAACWTAACHGVRRPLVPIALVGLCSIPPCKTSHASHGRRTRSTGDRSPGGARRLRRGQRGPQVEPGAQRPEGAVVRRQRAPGEAERREQEPTAL